MRRRDEHRPDIGLVERLLALRGVPAFAEFPDRELAVLAAQASVRVLHSGERLLAVGEGSTHIIVPVRGEVRVSRGDALLHLDELTAGIGMLSVLSETPSNLHVMAATDGVYMRIRRSVLSDALEDDFQMSARLLRRLALDMISELRGIRGDRLVPRQSPTLQIPKVGELDLVERLLVLRPSQVFSAASLDGVAQFAKLLEPVTHAAGELLWRERDASDGLLVIVDGTVACRSAGNPHVSRYRATGLLGAIDVLADDKRWATAKCETPVRALWADREALLDVLEDNFVLTVNLLKFIAGRTLMLREMADV